LRAEGRGGSEARAPPPLAPAVSPVPACGLVSPPPLPLRRGHEAHRAQGRAAPAAASAGDADRRAARRRDAEPLPAPLLAVARTGRRSGGRRGGADGDPRLVEAALRAHSFCAA